MKLKYLIPILLIFIIGAYILGSNITKKQTMQEMNPVKQELKVLLEEKNEENKQQQNVIDEYEREIEELHDEITQLRKHIRALEEVDSILELGTSSKETITRKIEGMEEDVQVFNYRIDPYNIHYQFDESFGVPEVNQNRITYSSQNNISAVSLEVIEHTSLEQVVSDLQKRFEKDGYEDKGELVSTPLEENGLRGKMQFFIYPVKGFYAYEIDEHVFVITYQYPGEAEDGMFPLLKSVRKSINVH
jgi:hypothetical protein